MAEEIFSESIKSLDARFGWWLSPSAMKRVLKPEEHDAVVHAIIARDRVKAISIYLSATESNLSEAQKFVSTLRAEVMAGALQPATTATSRS
jgi:prephenate dehydrogenase